VLIPLSRCLTTLSHFGEMGKNGSGKGPFVRSARKGGPTSKPFSLPKQTPILHHSPLPLRHKSAQF
jgi:hypothetical protein